MLASDKTVPLEVTPRKKKQSPDWEIRTPVVGKQ